MSKKKLDISRITNELRGQSVFFPTKPPLPREELAQVPPPLPAQEAQRPREPKVISGEPTKKVQSNHGVVIPRYQATTIPHYH